MTNLGKSCPLKHNVNFIQETAASMDDFLNDTSLTDLLHVL